MRLALAASVVAAGLASTFLLPGPRALAEDATAPAAGAGAVADGTTAEAPTPDDDALRCSARRARAAEAVGADGVLVVLSEGAAAGLTRKVPAADFAYLVPFAARDAAVVLFVEDGTPRQRIYLQPRREAFERWNGATVGPGDETAARHAFDAALPASQLAADLAALLGTRAVLHVSSGAPADGAARREACVGAVAEALGAGRTLVREDLRGGAGADDAGADGANGAGSVHVRDGAAVLAELRAVKDADEIARVRRAVLATCDGLLDSGRVLRPGLAEYQIQAVVELRCRLAGCSAQAFDSIVGSGPNSCVLHYLENRRIMQAGDLVVVDVGGEYRGYAADVTRTFPVSGEFTPRQAEVYDAVLEAQEAALAAVRPGRTLGEIHAVARDVLRRHGLDRWFIHGTCHSVGLEVHDAWRRERRIEPGSIITVEPGVYIPDEELGVRIEDTVLVTEDGAEVLSASAPKTRAALEALMAEPPPLAVDAPR